MAATFSVSLPDLIGEVLAEVVRREGASAGSLDGWCWRELKVLPVAWFDGLARILSRIEETVFGRRVCLMLVLL